MVFGDDFNNGLLEAQLITFGLHFQQFLKEKNEPLKNDMSIFDVKDYFTSLSQGQQSLLFEVKIRVESELSLRLYVQIEFDNAGYFILVRHEHCDR